jgi:hypothetical protein
LQAIWAIILEAHGFQQRIEMGAQVLAMHVISSNPVQ